MSNVVIVGFVFTMLLMCKEIKFLKWGNWGSSAVSGSNGNNLHCNRDRDAKNGYSAMWSELSGLTDQREFCYLYVQVSYVAAPLC
jgi:hypothetical protein